MRQNWLQQRIQPHRRWIPYIVLMGTLGLTALVTGYVESSANEKDRIRFQNAIQRTENSIENRLNTYIAMLRGGAGLFSANESVSRAQFHAYVNRLLLTENYPGVQGIGFAQRFAAIERAAIAATLQTQGGESAQLSPGFERSVYYPIMYLEPLDRRNRKAIGYDMFTEPTRRRAMERARDAGLPAASGKVTLVQEIDRQKQAGFLIYVPVYASGMIPDTVAARQAQLTGFVYSPFRANDLMQGIFGAEPYPAVNFQIYDGSTPNPASLLYSSAVHHGEAAIAGYRPRFTATLTTRVAGRSWTIQYATQPVFDATSSIGLVPYVAIGGTIVSLFLFALTLAQVRARTEAEWSAIQLRQSEYKLQRSHDELERRVKERTAELSHSNTILQAEIVVRQQTQEALEQTDQSLQKALAFAALLQQITEQVRDSLDETQILQTAVEALAIGLEVSSCNMGLYNLNQQMSTVAAESALNQPSLMGRTVRMRDFPEGYEALLSGQNLQFCFLHSNLSGEYVSVLASPVFDDQGVLGDLWLFRLPGQGFNEFEVRLVEQVAAQCAIALRQARLYEATQAEVKALEKVNDLKDDFLSTISHELRTPVASMKLAIRMLEMILGRAELNGDRPKAQQYLQILQAECQREIDLINDLLDLQRLVSGQQTLDLQTVNLPTWLRQLVLPFQERAESRGQRLWLELSPQELPPLVADITSLERILNELLNNACKYTPPGEMITLTVRSKMGAMQFSVRNSGVEIPAPELTRIFDKFYRVPNADPWKQGGTGLGLALAQRLVENMEGRIQVESAQGQTTFTVVIPNQLVRDRVPAGVEIR